jgi:hypothetical protein
MRKRAMKTIWVTVGCKSWYLDKEGVPIPKNEHLAA